MKVASNSHVWTQKTFDLTPYKGQTIRLYFNVHQDGYGDLTYMYLGRCVSRHTLTLQNATCPHPSQVVRAGCFWHTRGWPLSPRIATEDAEDFNLRFSVRSVLPWRVLFARLTLFPAVPYNRGFRTHTGRIHGA